MKQLVRVLIADGQVHTRQGLQALLAAWPEIEVVGAAADGRQAVDLVEQCQPDVVLIDIRMPGPALSALDAGAKREVEGLDGLEAIGLIRSRWPQIRIVVLAMYAARRAAAMAAGADAFLLKGCPAETLQAALLEPRSGIDLGVTRRPASGLI